MAGVASGGGTVVVVVVGRGGEGDRAIEAGRCEDMMSAVRALCPIL